MWRLWSKALGAKSGNTDREANIVAIIRTILTLSCFITNTIIVLGVLRHWNN